MQIGSIYGDEFGICELKAYKDNGILKEIKRGFAELTTFSIFQAFPFRRTKLFG